MRLATIQAGGAIKPCSGIHEGPRASMEKRVLWHQELFSIYAGANWEASTSPYGIIVQREFAL